MVFTFGAGALLVTCFYDVQLHFLTAGQLFATVAAIGAAGTFGVSPTAFEDVLHEQRTVVGGVAALIVYASVAALAPWLMASASVLLAAAGTAVLVAMPADRVSSRTPLIVVAYVIARSMAFFATTFLRGAQ